MERVLHALGHRRQVEAARQRDDGADDRFVAGVLADQDGRLWIRETAAGDPTLDANPDLWNNNQPPYSVDGSVALAESDDLAPGLSFARIDYNLPEEGLAPGVYYLRARGKTSAQTGPYAIRALLAPDENYAAWKFATYNNPDSYESDDNPKSGGVPNKPIPLGLGLGGQLNRYLTAADVDWFVLTLPQDP